MPPRTLLLILPLALVSFAWAEEMGPPALATQPTGLLVEGIVVNHFGGGIADATVRLEPPDAAGTSRPLAEGKTDQMGDFRIHLPVGVKLPVQIRIQKDGYSEHFQAVEAPEEEDETPYVDVTLDGAGKLEATVTAKATGKPVAGAQVRCENGGREVETVSDDAGRFTIEQTVRGPTTLDVHAEGFAIERKMIKIESDAAEAIVELRPERAILLTVVTIEGDPAGKVLVEAIVEPAQNYITGTTDDAGKASLKGVGTDAVGLRLRLSGERYIHASEFTEPIELPSPQTAPADPVPPPFEHRAVIQLSATIRGTVTNDKGEPIVGVRVIAGREVRSDMPMIWTALDGTYELPGLAPGTNVISYQHDAFATLVREIQLAVGQAVTSDVRMELGKPMGGIVVNEEGKPLNQVWVTAESWKGYSTLGVRTITGEDGVFSLPHLPEGEIEFSFVLSGFEPLMEQKFATGRTDLRIALKATSRAPEQAPEMTPKLKEGDAVPELTMTGTDGTSYKLSTLRGKYVFLDCWASWCGPCMAEVPNMKALRAATKNRPDFVMIGLSLDREEADFRKAIEKNAMDWPQVMGPKSGANESFEVLEGFAIPYTCLIGPDGKLLAQHLRGPGVVDEVKKHLPK